MDWYTATQVSVSNGSDIVRVVSGEEVDALRPHDSIEISTFNGRDIKQVYTEDGTGDQIIQLVEPWPHATQTEESAQVVPTAAHFNDSTEILKNVYEHVFTQLGSYFSFGTQASGDVTFKAVRVDESDVTVRCINQWNTDLSALEASASSSVADLNAIDTTLNGAGGLVDIAAQVSNDLDSVDSTLSGYVTTTKDYHDSVSAWHENIHTWFPVMSGYHVDISGWKTEAESARDLAEQYRDEAETFKNQAGNIVGGNFVTKSTTVNGKELSTDIVLDKADIELGNVDDTSDADKPVSTATQLALDDKSDKVDVALALADKVDNASISNINNTSDADKPISDATQAALDNKLENTDLTDLQNQINKVRKLALAGL